jgi:manganese/zinc/iron transport system permease protein
MNNSFFCFFTDPVLRSPTIGCMLMCLASSLIGVLTFIRRRSLLGEALSHAVYPGVIIGSIIVGWLFSESSNFFLIFIMLGGAITSLFGLYAIDLLVRKIKIANDAALCFILSSFFGIGVFLASYIQFLYPSILKKTNIYLYGQAATMRDIHVFIYALLALVIIAFIFLLFRQLEAIYFNRDYAYSIGIRTVFIEFLVFFFLILSIIIGMRSVGIVLMSGMLLAPAISARQFTNRLSTMFFLSGLFGIGSGFFGNYFSYNMSYWFSLSNNGKMLCFPTGPIIVLLACSFAIFSLLFAPKKGIVFCFLRSLRFKIRIIEENILKNIYKNGVDKGVKIAQLEKIVSIPKFLYLFIAFRMRQKGWIKKNKSSCYLLSQVGEEKALHVIRLHRLWEVYLDYLGVESDKIHKNAEEMEHSISEELEEKLEKLLSNPKKDPHNQPIPSKASVIL